jgi:hypothetical protein
VEDGLNIEFEVSGKLAKFLSSIHKATGVNYDTIVMVLLAMAMERLA